MKTCLCCCVIASDDAIWCANCGEASWSATSNSDAKDESHVPEGFSPPDPIVDPEIAVDAPRVLRRTRKPTP